MKAPRPLERDIQEALVEAIDIGLSPDWRYTHIASGGKRDIRTAVALKRGGVKKGFPDFVFVHKSGRVFWVELKRPGTGRLTPEQQDMRDFFQCAGRNFLVTDELNDAIITLRDLGILRKVTVMA